MVSGPSCGLPVSQTNYFVLQSTVRRAVVCGVSGHLRHTLAVLSMAGAWPQQSHEESVASMLCAAGLEAGKHGVPYGGRQHAPAVVHRLAAQQEPRHLRQLPGQKPTVTLAVGPEALLGLPAGCRPGMRCPGLAVLLRLLGRSVLLSQ